MKRKFKIILSVFLCTVMVFTAFSTAFADEIQEKNVYCMINSKNSTGTLSKGESLELHVEYHSEGYEDVNLEWSTEGDSCIIEYAEPTENNGIVTEATVTSVTHGDFYVTVRLISSDGQELDNALFKVVSNVPEELSFLERYKQDFEELKLTATFLFYMTVLLPIIAVPAGIICEIMILFGANEQKVLELFTNYIVWMDRFI